MAQQRQLPALPEAKLDSLALWARQITQLLQRGDIVMRGQGAGNSSVRAATTANIDLATDLEAGDSLDGVTLAAGNLVLVKNQTAPEENGVYKASVSGAASRADAFSTYDAHVGAIIAVEEGTAGGDTLWQCTSAAGGTLGTTAIAWTQVGIPAAGSIANAQLANMAEATIKGRASGAGTGAPQDLTITQTLDMLGATAQGDIAYRDASAWVQLAAGTPGQFLQTQGAGANPKWAGAVTAIASGALSSVATLDIPLGSADLYEIDLMSIRPATDDVELWARFSQSGSFLSGGTNYGWGYIGGGGTAQWRDDVSDSEIVIADEIGNGATDASTITLRIARPSASSFMKMMHWYGVFMNVSPSFVMTTGGGGLRANTNAIDGVRFQFSSGNIASGHYAVRAYSFT